MTLKTSKDGEENNIRWIEVLLNASQALPRVSMHYSCRKRVGAARTTYDGHQHITDFVLPAAREFLNYPRDLIIVSSLKQNSNYCVDL